jgi:hypothetical protein
VIDYPVSIVFTGDVSEKDIHLEIVDLPTLPDNLVEQIDLHWESELKLNPDLFSGPLLSPVSVVQEAGQVRLKCGVTDYKTFMGSTSDPTIPEAFRRRAIGVLAVTVSADGFVLVGVRSPRVDWGTLRHVVPAGRLKPSDGSVFRGIEIEFDEELDVNPREDLQSLVCVGLVKDETWGRLNFEFIFMARSLLSATDLIKKAADSKSANEHCQIEAFPWDPDSVGVLLNAEPSGFVPTGWAALAICLRREFGEEVVPLWNPMSVTYEAHMGRRLDMTGIR